MTIQTAQSVTTTFVVMCSLSTTAINSINFGCCASFADLETVTSSNIVAHATVLHC